MNPPTKVVLTRFAEKQVSKLPAYIVEYLLHWIETVEEFGIREVRKIPGYHDEPLKGDRRGQRSIRLNRSYRVIYIEKDQELEISVIEVNKHDY